MTRRIKRIGCLLAIGGVVYLMWKLWAHPQELDVVDRVMLSLCCAVTLCQQAIDYLNFAPIAPVTIRVEVKR